MKNKRFLTINELKALIHLTKTKDLSEIFKNFMKLEINEDEIKEDSKNKKNSRFKFQLNFPTIEENKFVEINQDNMKNNFLSYTEIIMGDYLLKIE